MKRINQFFAAIVCFFTVSTVCNAADRPIPSFQLPEAAKEFVRQNFPGRTIIYAEKDWNFFKTRYEVSLNDGTEIDFNKDGTFDKVDCHWTAVPEGFIPPAIRTFVSQNFPGAVIVKIDKKRRGYNVELSNDIELKFNHHGDFLRYDD